MCVYVVYVCVCVSGGGCVYVCESVCMWMWIAGGCVWCVSGCVYVWMWVCVCMCVFMCVRSVWMWIVGGCDVCVCESVDVNCRYVCMWMWIAGGVCEWCVCV